MINMISRWKPPIFCFLSSLLTWLLVRKKSVRGILVIIWTWTVHIPIRVIAIKAGFSYEEKCGLSISSLYHSTTKANSHASINNQPPHHHRRRHRHGMPRHFLLFTLKHLPTTLHMLLYILGSMLLVTAQNFSKIVGVTGQEARLTQ